jgi:hypothetical protein
MQQWRHGTCLPSVNERVHKANVILQDKWMKYLKQGHHIFEREKNKKWIISITRVTFSGWSSFSRVREEQLVSFFLSLIDVILCCLLTWMNIIFHQMSLVGKNDCRIREFCRSATSQSTDVHDIRHHSFCWSNPDKRRRSFTSEVGSFCAKVKAPIRTLTITWWVWHAVLSEAQYSFPTAVTRKRVHFQNSGFYWVRRLQLLW